MLGGELPSQASDRSDLDVTAPLRVLGYAFLRPGAISDGLSLHVAGFRVGAPGRQGRFRHGDQFAYLTVSEPKSAKSSSEFSSLVTVQIAPLSGLPQKIGRYFGSHIDNLSTG